MASEIVYPRGGWSRAMQYVVHRIRRLPDQPHRIGRGIAAGTFISFTPFFGIHLLGAVLIAWIIRGNLFAAVLGTFIGNPVTTPIIAVTSVGLGRWMLGVDGSMSPALILRGFTSAGGQLWHNFLSIFDGRVAEWDRLSVFMEMVFLPYLVGGLLPGVVAAVIAHYLTVPVVLAYHKRRELRIARRLAKAERKLAEQERG